VVAVDGVPMGGTRPGLVGGGAQATIDVCLGVLGVPETVLGVAELDVYLDFVILHLYTHLSRIGSRLYLKPSPELIRLLRPKTI
jgi:hypothetical protein